MEYTVCCSYVANFLQIFAIPIYVPSIILMTQKAIVCSIYFCMQLLEIFVHEKMSAFVTFYNSNKEFVDGLGKK